MKDELLGKLQELNHGIEQVETELSVLKQTAKEMRELIDLMDDYKD